jgi:hypothetical protein
MSNEEKQKTKAITIYGYTRSLSLLVIFLVGFLGMLFIFVDAVVSRTYPYLIIAAFGTLVGFFAFALIYGIVRYFAEQIITMVSANMILKDSAVNDADEDSDKEAKTA